MNVYPLDSKESISMLNPFHFENSFEESSYIDRKHSTPVREGIFFRIKQLVLGLKIFSKKETLKKNPPFLDTHKILKGTVGNCPIDPSQYNWFLNQAILLSQSANIDAMTQNEIDFLMLHAYGKAAPFSDKNKKNHEIQVSPFLQPEVIYFRDVAHPLLEYVHQAYANKMKMDVKEVHLIDSSLFKDVLKREMPSEFYTEIENMKEFKKTIKKIISYSNKTQIKDEFIIIDVSKLLVSDDVEKINTTINYIKKYLLKKSNGPDAHHVLDKIQIVGFVNINNQTLLLTPLSFSKKNIIKQHNKLVNYIKDTLKHTCHQVNPIQAKEAWLKIESREKILNKLGLPSAQLATTGSIFPKVCESYEDFLSQPIINKFRSLSKDTEIPYLNILPEVTVRLLEGFREHDIETVFKEKGLEDLLSVSYFRIFNAMQEAILKKQDQYAFNNQIELVHQEIQNILYLVSPHEDETLAKAINKKLTEGPDPIIPPSLGSPQTNLKASGMHCLSSLINAVEAQKGNSHLNIAFLKDSYYESSATIDKSRAHAEVCLDGKLFREQGDIKKSFNKPSPGPIDLFVCEFHHNISLTNQVYQSENILEQIKGMVEKELVAEKFTVAIDNTINLEQSKDIQELLRDEKIQELVKAGRLNIVFYRSAQKFDMLGLDNYNGGIVTAINEPSAYTRFNNQMNHSDDKLKGLSYQGLAHLHKYSGPYLDLYRQAIIDNTRRFYAHLPKNMIYKKGQHRLVEVSEMQDPNLVYVAIKYSKIRKALKGCFSRLKIQNLFPFTSRPSFGFSTTNIVIIGGNIRISLGLEDPKKIEEYASYFKMIQGAIENGLPFNFFIKKRLNKLFRTKN